MRADSQGFWWSDQKGDRAKIARNSSVHWGPMPGIPDGGWRPPTEFPNLSSARVIGVDTETYDPELTEAGPGWGRGKGHIIGASLAVEDGTSWYFPMRHGIDETGKQRLPPEHASMNMDPDNVLRFLNATLNNNIPKVGANFIYDLGWLNWEGVSVGGRHYDIQYAEALLDSETPDVALDALAFKYLGIGKTTETLYEWLSSWNRKPANERQRKWLYRAPPCLAGPYAESDASLPISILGKQWPAMHNRGVLELFDIECRLTPLLVAMRMKGAPVDVNKAEEVYENFGGRLESLQARIDEAGEGRVNPNSPEDLTAAFKRLGLKIPKKIDKTKGEEVVSFDKDRLKVVSHPLADLVLEHRALAKVRNTFMKSYIMDKHVNGRIHCSFHPLKGQDNGTRSGRFSSADPNLQNIPVQTEEGKLVRQAFAAHKSGRWRSFDYSSVEYRLLVNFAVGPGADDVRHQFRVQPKTDYHDFVGNMIHRMVGIELQRTNVKRINFGIIYGMALRALATSLKLPLNEAKELLDAYHHAIPYARATMDACANEVHTTGMVRTILNRASDFNVWGKKGFDEEGRSALSYEAACRKWGSFNIERQHTHKALNRKLQGSAADVMKVAMLEAWEGGLFHESACGIPVLTVHDELDFEDLGDVDNPAWVELVRTMENALSDRLRVPLLVDGDYGETWADAH